MTDLPHLDFEGAARVLENLLLGGYFDPCTNVESVRQRASVLVPEWSVRVKIDPAWRRRGLPRLVTSIRPDAFQLVLQDAQHTRHIFEVALVGGYFDDYLRGADSRERCAALLEDLDPATRELFLKHGPVDVRDLRLLTQAEREGKVGEALKRSKP